MNRAARRRAAREQKASAKSGAGEAPLYFPPNHADDRVLAGMRLLPESMPLIETEFETLHQTMGLIEDALRRAGSDADTSHWFPNNIAALACLTRAYRGLQAAATSCVMGHYEDARATLRVVYEAAGLARALAKSTPDAEKWLHDGHYKNDGFARKVGAEMAESKRDAKIAFEDFYKMTSKYAHPMAVGVLPLLIGPDDRFGPRLYPEFDETAFKVVAREITTQALFTAFALRKAAAEPEALPAAWHKKLTELALRISDGVAVQSEEDWARHDDRHQVLIGKVRHDDELEATLDADPASVRNLKKKWKD